MPSPLAALKGLNQQVKQAGDEAVGNAKAVTAKKAMVKEYTDSLQTPSPVGKTAGKPSKSDLVKSGAKYGDRPGEERIDTKSMTKPLGSFKKGTNKVKKTGVYKLHKGEAVATAKQASKVRSMGGMAKMLSGDMDKDGM
jgi:hypothetical protein